MNIDFASILSFVALAASLLVGVRVALGSSGRKSWTNSAAEERRSERRATGESLFLSITGVRIHLPSALILLVLGETLHLLYGKS